MHWATRQGHKGIAELLISEGADVSAKNKNGLTAMDLAIRFKEPKLAELLRKLGGKTGEELKATGNWSTQRTIPMIISQQNKKNSICETN